MSSATSAGAMSRENLCPAFKGAGTFSGPCRKQQRCSSWHGKLPAANSIGAVFSVLLSPGQHGWPAGMAWWCAAWPQPWPSHCTGCMNVPGMHDEHRSHGHLCPCHHGHKKGHRNVLLQHLTYESSRPRTGMPDSGHASWVGGRTPLTRNGSQRVISFIICSIHK